MAFQDNLHSVHLRTVQQLKVTNTHHRKKKCLLPACSQTYSFYPLSSNTVPIVTASAPFPIIYILLRGITESRTDTETPKPQYCLPHPHTARSSFWTAGHQDDFAACHNTRSSTQPVLLH